MPHMKYGPAEYGKTKGKKRGGKLAMPFKAGSKKSAASSKY